ncbi:glycosyltransferase family 2 protein [Pseudomonas sp. NFXW11]
MCSFNGVSFLKEQLDSFERQHHRNWELYVSDDGSQDDTLELIKRWGCERVKIFDGPRKGFSANFLSLTCREEINADYYAWSDQDDIWRQEKLQRALSYLQKVPANVPALYCGRTELVSETGLHVGYSPNFSLAPHFNNALVQNIGGGNTMVFNQAARLLLQKAGGDVIVPSHDWWAYQLVSGSGGVVLYDSEPMVLYRQHGDNLIGANSSWLARLRRLRMIFKGRFYEWNGQNIIALESMFSCLKDEHRATLSRFKNLRNKSLFARVFGFFRLGLYRQTLMGNLGLVLAVLLKKI